MQPLGLSCGATFGSLQSTDCAVRVDSPSAFVPLPGVSLASVEFLYLQASSGVTLRWGGAVAVLTGTAVAGGVTFVGGEVFEFDVEGTSVTVNFSAGSFSLAQVRDLMNAAAISAGVGFMPVSLDSTGTILSISGNTRAQSATVAVVQALALIGFASVVSAAGTDPTQMKTQGFLNQWPTGEGVSDVEIMGAADVVVLAGGS
jgi:hypothetical protein